MFKVGNTVRLKSGGPIMTISKILADGELLCVWFEHGHGDYKKIMLHQDMLEAAKRD